MNIRYLFVATLLMLGLGAAPGRLKAADICSSAVGNIVSNCGFETGDLTDWNTNSSAHDDWVVSTAGGGIAGVTSNSGDFFAQTGCVGAVCIQPDDSGAGSAAWLYQDLATTSGDSYDLTFYYAAGPSTGPDELQVLWGDSSTTLTATTAGTGTCDPTTNCVYDNTSGPNSTAYTEVTVDDLVATSGSTRLEFLGRQDPSWNGLDSISVVQETSSSATPEPASLLLFGAGLLALSFGLRRRYKGAE